MRARELEDKKQEIGRRMQGEWQVRVREGGQEEQAGTEQGYVAPVRQEMFWIE